VLANLGSPGGEEGYVFSMSSRGLPQLTLLPL
jgi:hypothetical protein